MARSPVRTTLTEQTYEALRERILDQTLQPSARLNIDALSRELNVSTSPLREALAKLEAEGLVVLELYTGYSVAPNPTAKYLEQLIDFRILTEGYCVRIGAQVRSPDTVAELKDAIARMTAINRIGTRYRDYRKFIEADARFHQILVDSASNEVISKSYAALHVIIVQSRLYVKRHSGGSAQEVVDEHLAVLSAYEKGDGEAAAEAIRRHLEGGKRRLLPLADSTLGPIPSPAKGL
jgi:DNA-binding GntR family transcriptional regulator